MKPIEAARRGVGLLPAGVLLVTLGFLGFYFLIHLVYFSFQPVTLLSERGARAVLAQTGTAQKRSVERMKMKNVDGVVFREETLADLEDAGRVFVASGSDLLRIFKLQSIASYYVFEQVRDKNLKSGGSYLFFTDAPMFEYVRAALGSRLDAGEIAVFERGIFRGDGSFPDNFILESTIPPDSLRQKSLGWPMTEIQTTMTALSLLRSDSLWPVYAAQSPAAQVPDPNFRLEDAFLRDPYRSIRIVDEPVDLVSLRGGSELKDLLSAPALKPGVLVAAAALIVFAALLRMFEWLPWAPILAAIFAVLTLSFLPTQWNWVVAGLSALVPAAAVALWAADTQSARSGAHPLWTDVFSFFKFSARLVLCIGVPGWLLASLAWIYPQLPVSACATIGNGAIPILAAALFLTVWGIESTNRPIYPRHIRVGLELAAASAVLVASAEPWLPLAASVFAGSHWLILYERSRLRRQTESPGNYASFFAASALGLKLFLVLPPLAAGFALCLTFGLSVILSRYWISKMPAPA